MKHRDTMSMMLRNAKWLIGLALVLGLAGCGLGDVVMPNPPTGVPADRSVGVVAPVPAPVPHTLEGRSECFACHAIGAVDAPSVPADHEQDVTLCTTCHAVWLAPGIAAAASPAIPHEVEGRSDCLVCHKLGTADAPRVPDNHNGLTGDICQTCHKMVEEIAGAGEEEGMSAAEAPSIPHGLEGFGACTQCHEEGGPGIPRFPEDHAGRTDDLCTACHRPAAESSEAEPTAEATSTPTETSPEVGGDASNGQALFAVKCAPCHGPEGEGTSIAQDPLNDAARLADLTDEEVVTVIRMGLSGKMPASPQLSDQEVLDLVAFLRSWQ
ncbi:MAG: c-type cytochrome [Anaerolineae bacterium]|jgi:cytochrome c5